MGTSSAPASSSKPAAPRATCTACHPELTKAKAGRQTNFEHTLRLAISLGGDADTQAAIAGGVGEAFFGGLPERIETELRAVLEPDLLEVVDRFNTHRSE
jgi:ADP-ribosylglycohydrolase